MRGVEQRAMPHSNRPQTSNHPQTQPPHRPATATPEPRWPAIIAGFAMAGMYAVLHQSLLVGPRWLLPALVLVLVIPAQVARHRGQQEVNQGIGHTLSAVVTLFLVLSLALLVQHLPGYKGNPVVLLRSALMLWLINVLVFASWYWRLDAGGPHQRDTRPGHANGSFLFPQMTMSEERLAEAGQAGWSPQFVDYLFLAFNTSTALSPADTAALGRWAKVLMMVQASISLTIIAVVASRAVNILPSS